MTRQTAIEILLSVMAAALIYFFFKGFSHVFDMGKPEMYWEGYARGTALGFFCACLKLPKIGGA